MAVCPGCGWFEGEHTRGRPVPRWQQTQVNWNQPTPIKQGAVKESIGQNDPRSEQTPETVMGYGYGYKILAVDAYGNLRSPQQNTIWPPYEGLEAPEPPSLDNTAGIYVTETPTAYDLAMYNKQPGTAIVTCLAKCQIWGKCVKHKNGYRAQHAMPESITLQPDLSGPDDPQVQKLAMAIRQKYAIDVEIASYHQNFEERPKPPPGSRYQPTPRQKRVYEKATNQQEFDAMERNGAQNIRIEGDVMLRNAGYGGTNVFIASGNVTMYNGKATAAGGTITQYGGTLVARGESRVVFLGGAIRAGGGDGVVIEVQSPLKFVQASRNVGGGQSWRNNEGSVYFTRYWRGTVVNRGQQNAQALKSYLDNNADWMGPEMRKNLEGLLRHHKYISSVKLGYWPNGTRLRFLGDRDARGWNRSGLERGDMGTYGGGADYVPGLDAGQFTVWPDKYPLPGSQQRAISYWDFTSMSEEWEPVDEDQDGPGDTYPPANWQPAPEIQPVAHAFEQYVEAHRHEINGDEDWTRQGSGSFYTDQRKVKCPNCAAETDLEVCPNCGKGLSVEWQKANDKAIPFDHPPQGGTPENEFWTDVNPVPRPNPDKTDNSFPSMTASALDDAMWNEQDKKIHDDGYEYGRDSGSRSAGYMLENASPEQADEIWNRYMRGDMEDIYANLEENPLSGEWADGPRIRDMIDLTGVSEEDEPELLNYYADLWMQGFQKGQLEGWEETIAQLAGKMDQPGDMTFPAEWSEG